MTGFTRGAVRLTETSAALSAGVAALTGALSSRFQRSLEIRVDEQRVRIERTGIAGMI